MGHQVLFDLDWLGEVGWAGEMTGKVQVSVQLFLPGRIDSLLIGHD